MRTRPLSCRSCGKKIGTVHAKPALRRKLVMYGLAIAFVFELMANIIVKLIGI